MSFLIIPFRFSASNFRPNDIVSGAPSLNAISGMSHNVQRVISGDLGISSFQVDAFSIVFFSVDLDKSTIKRPTDRKKMDNQSLDDIRRGRGEAALVLKYSVASDDDFTRFVASMDDDSLYWALSAELRFAGGETFIGTRGEFGVSSLPLSVEDDWAATIKKLMKAYPTQGQIWEDKKSLITAYSAQEGKTALDAMLELLELSNYQQKKSFSKLIVRDEAEVTPAADGGGDNNNDESAISTDDDFDLDAIEMSDLPVISIESPKRKIQDEYVGILLPVSNGFHEIGESRDGQYFGESILSLVRSRVLGSLLRSLNDGSETWGHHFWRQEYLPHHKIHRSVSVL
jgi:hypothetical protein